MLRCWIGWMMLSLVGGLGAQSAISLNGANAFGRTKVGSFSAQNTTWEAWVRLPAYVKTTAGGPILFRWGMYSHGSPWVLSKDGTAGAGTLHGGKDLKTKSGVLKIGKWHHLATVYEGQALPTVRFYLDGKLVGKQKGISSMRYGTTWELVLGATGYRGYANFLAGELDEVRLSTVQRYTKDFVPQRRFQADAATFGLWHFDSGKGALALDASRNKRHFALVGGYKWVKGLDEPSLTVSTSSLSLQKGGRLDFRLNAGKGEANNLSLLLGSLSGTKPGIRLGAHKLPLNVDAYFSLLVTSHNLVLPGALQFLDAKGQGRAQLIVPPGLPASLVGKTMSHAYLTFGWTRTPSYRFTSVATQTPLLR